MGAGAQQVRDRPATTRMGDGPGGGRRRGRRGLLPVLAAAALVVGLAALMWSWRTPADVGPPAGLPQVTTEGDAGTTASGEPDPRERDDRIDPFDDAHPALAGLDPELRSAVQSAARDAAAADVDLWLTSGYRSAEYQQELLDRAEQTYGSLEEALKLVAKPETSSHVTGNAVDIGPTAAADWVGRFGDAYGLCQTYANEMWHFELATTPGGECPAQLPDATP